MQQNLLLELNPLECTCSFEKIVCDSYSVKNPLFIKTATNLSTTGMAEYKFDIGLSGYEFIVFLC